MFTCLQPEWACPDTAKENGQNRLSHAGELNGTSGECCGRSSGNSLINVICEDHYGMCDNLQ